MIAAGPPGQPQQSIICAEAVFDTDAKDTDFYETVKKRHTVREFLDREVDLGTIKRILDAGNRAPTWNHNRSWQYIILRTDGEKESAFEYAKKTADRFDAEKYLNTRGPTPRRSGRRCTLTPCRGSSRC